MDNSRVNRKPPPGWFKNIKVGDFVWDSCLNRGVVQITSTHMNDNGFYVVEFVGIDDIHIKDQEYRVDENGRLCGSQDFLPLIKSIPDDAGDGE